MFRDNFVSKINKLNFKKEDGGILTEMILQGQLTDSQMIDLGADVVAMVKSREATSSQTIPFKAAELDQDYEDRTLTMFAGTPGDEEPRVKFERADVTVSKIKLTKSEETPTRPDLVLTVKVPPIAEDDILWLIRNLGFQVLIGVTASQSELELDSTGEGDGE